MIQNLLILSSGLVLLLLGSHWLVKSLKGISIYFKLKPLFLSLVVLGFVSSSPEFFVTINAGMKGLSAVALGNILGSNIINILLVLGLAGLFYGLNSNQQIVRFDMPFLIGGLALLGVCSIDKSLSFLDACLFLALFLVYLVLLFKQRKADNQEALLLDTNFSLVNSLALLAAGFIILFIGSRLAVDSSLKLVEALSLSQKFAGIFILSLSTSLPELAASLQAMLKGEDEMALGNIIGSNMFNSLFVLGSASLINPVSFIGLYYDYFFMFVVSGVLFLNLIVFKKIPKVVFALFICSYFIYIGYFAR